MAGERRLLRYRTIPLPLGSDIRPWTSRRAVVNGYDRVMLTVGLLAVRQSSSIGVGTQGLGGVMFTRRLARPSRGHFVKNCGTNNNGVCVIALGRSELSLK